MVEKSWLCPDWAWWFNWLRVCKSCSFSRKSWRLSIMNPGSVGCKAGSVVTKAVVTFCWCSKVLKFACCSSKRRSSCRVWARRFEAWGTWGWRPGRPVKEAEDWPWFISDEFRSGPEPFILMLDFGIVPVEEDEEPLRPFMDALRGRWNPILEAEKWERFSFIRNFSFLNFFSFSWI